MNGIKENSLIRTASDNAHFVGLIKLLDIELWDRYPDIMGDYEGFNVFEEPIRSILLFEQDAVGCGAIKSIGDAMEIKRFFVHASARKKGYGLRILSELENWAKELGYKKLILESGYRQPEANSLYEKFGFQKIDNYDPYIGKEHSLCMGKSIA